MVDMANCADVEMRLFALEFATGGTDSERGGASGGGGFGGRGEVENCGRVEEGRGEAS